MTVGKILVLENGRATFVAEGPYKEERELQEYLEQYPSLIPLADLEDREVELLLVGSEVGVPTGSIDLLFVDSEGTPTIVETKLARNPDMPRAVIGQVLEYAAHVSTWDLQKIEAAATAYQRRISPPPKPTGQAIHAMLAQPEFRLDLENTLRAKRLRLIIAVDQLVEPLPKTTAFLNEMSTFDILVLQVQRFRDGEHRAILVSSLAEISPGTVPPPTWDLPRFQVEMARRCPSGVVDVALKLHEFALDLSKPGEGYAVTWGKGATGGFYCKKLIDGSWITLFGVDSSVKLWVQFGPKQKALLSQTLESYHRALTEIPGVKLPADVLASEASRYPSLDLRLFVQPERLEAFKQAVRLLVGEGSATEP